MVRARPVVDGRLLRGLRRRPADPRRAGDREGPRRSDRHLRHRRRDDPARHAGRPAAAAPRGPLGPAHAADRLARALHPRDRDDRARLGAPRVRRAADGSRACSWRPRRASPTSSWPRSCAPDRRGAGLSALGIISGLGYGAVAGMLLLVPLTPLDWRLFYLVALVPLGLAAYLRRRLPETRAFLVAAAPEPRADDALAPRRSRAHRRRLWRVVRWSAASGSSQTSGFFYASELAQTTTAGAALFTVPDPGVGGLRGPGLLARRADQRPRRPPADDRRSRWSSGAAGTVLVFTQVPALFPPGLFLLTAAGSCFAAASVAYIAELFPTEVRATATPSCWPARSRPARWASPCSAGWPSVVSPYAAADRAGRLPRARRCSRCAGLPETARRDLVEEDRLGRTVPASA